MGRQFCTLCSPYVLISLLLVCFILPSISAMATANILLSVDFEIWGRVQGVFFRKFTYEKAKSLGLKGWVRNTRDGTVEGRIEGEAREVEAMQSWLQHTGSPQS